MTTTDATTTGTETTVTTGTTGTTTSRMTTERSGFSVRTRLTVTVAALLLAVLTVTGVVIHLVESNRLQEQIRADVTQEFDEFGKLFKGTDPETGDPFTNPDALLNLFLRRNLPGEDELLIGWVSDSPRFTSGAHGEWARTDEFEDAARELVATGARRVMETAEHGTVLLSVQPLSLDTESTLAPDDALVIAVFLDAAERDLQQLMRTYVIVAALSWALVVLLAAWQAKTLLAPLGRLSQATRRISATDLSARLPVSGNDDLTALTVTTNEMLARLEASFASQRRFLDDAGHELKTPLTILRGHLELMDASDADELEETRALLLDEVDRMSRLVEDLILLAKSRRPDFVVASDTDLDQLITGVLAKIRALGDRDWMIDEVAHLRVPLDEQRITQALLQLADNAVKHTDPGAQIGIGASVVDSVVRLWVRDTGDGIAEADREAVLERFGRSSVRAGDEGFGLGLSIVAAIADAHGGTVLIADADPTHPTSPGTRVEIHIPIQGE